MSSSYQIALDLGWLIPRAEGIRHWTLKLFGTLIETHPEHHFTLVWPWPHLDIDALRLLERKNTTSYVIRPRGIVRRTLRKLKLIDERSRLLNALKRVDLIYWGMHSEICFPWLHLLPNIPKLAAAFDAIPIILQETQTAQGLAEWRLHYSRIKELQSNWVTLSECSKIDLHRLCDLDTTLGTVIYPSHNFEESPLDSSDSQGDHSRFADLKPYVLTVGTLEPRKNHARLFTAFKTLREDALFKEWKLLVVGGAGWLCDQIIEQAKNTPNVILAGRLSHEDLPMAYRNASVFAFPSRYEGFGLPVAEAMHFGLPVLTSSTSSLPEVVGESGLLVDPENTDAITAGLRQLMGNPELQNKLSLAAQEAAQRFSWTKAADQLMDLMNRIIHENRQQTQKQVRENVG